MEPRLTHSGAVKYRPQTTPDTERSSVDDGKADMVGGTDATCQADEAGGEGVAQPDAYPRLPPRQTVHDHGGADHPRVDVEGVGDPEADEVPGPPLAALGLDGFEIIVRQLEQIRK